MKFLDQKLTYVISPFPVDRFSNSIEIGDYFLSYPDQTVVYESSTGGGSIKVVVIGYCIDARGKIDKQEIASHLSGVLKINNCSWQGFLNESKRLAGNFVVAAFCPEYFRLIGDAAGYLGIYYKYKDSFCASSDALLAEVSSSPLNEVIEGIRSRASSDTQPLPWDVTDFKDVFLCLPNFYLDFINGEAHRFFPIASGGPEKGEFSSISKCLSESLKLVKNIAKCYCDDFEVICPLTSGWDSRLNYALLKNYTKWKPSSYTFRHKGFDSNTGDIFIPRRIVPNVSTHSVIETLVAPRILVDNVRSSVSKGASLSNISLAYTLKVQFPSKAIVNGDIVDQIGGSLIGQDLPEVFATKKFFKCKTHNYSPLVDDFISEWIKTVPNAKASLYDLFAWESRLGRWAHEANKIYSFMGVYCLNLFNCREVIELWLMIPRSERSKNCIHKFYFKAVDEHMLDLPFNPGSKLNWLKKWKATFLAATYAKYLLNR